MTTRRAFLAALLAGALLAPVGPRSAQAQQRPPIVEIRVDVSRLIELGLGANAGVIKAGMERELAGLRRSGAARGAGAVLVVRMRGVFMASYAGGGSGQQGGNNDSMDSEATLIGPGGTVLASWPILSTISSSSGGAWYLPDIDRRRLDALVVANAAWIRRYVAG